MSTSFHFDDIDRFTTGTVGEPGQRVFYLQIQVGTQVVSFRLEKMQVASLVGFLTDLLADLPPTDELLVDMSLSEPVVAEWVLGAIGARYEESADRIMLVADELVTGDDEGDIDDGASLRFLATREQMAAFAVRARAVVGAGRPPCPLCGAPIDSDGHMCVRTNGHHRKTEAEG